MSSHIKEKIESRENSVGTWISIGHPSVAEAVAQLDLDFVLIDMEHTPMSLETVTGIVRGVNATPGDTDVIVRPAWNDPVRLKRVVDIGMAGVMVPMVETVDEADQLVESVRYPPDGNRGIAGSRATGYGWNFEEYVTSANGSILTIAQIESERGLQNAEEIAAVDGIDALFVGPADLSGSLDVFAEWNSETYVDAIETVIGAGEATDVPVGTFTSDLDGVGDCIDRGFDFLIAGKDASFLMDGTAKAIERYERALDDDVRIDGR